MKILHLSSERTWRGGEQQIAYLILESIQRGLEIVVACKKGSAFEAWCKQQGITYSALSFSNELDLGTVLGIKKICNSHHIDLIHAHSSHSHAMAVWSKVLGGQGRLIVSRRVDFPIKNNPFSRLKFNHRAVEQYICVSKAIENILRSDLKSPEKCLTVHSGIDAQRFEGNSKQFKVHDHFKLPHHTQLIGNISAIADHKDYFTFVDAAEMVLKTQPNTKFIVIGDGPLTALITDYITSKNLGKDVLLMGFRDDVPELIKDLDIFLMTSKTEGLGTTLLDAGLNELPIVATRAGGIPEFVEHRQTGLLADVGDAQTLAQQVLELLNDPELGRELGHQAKLKVIHEFSKENTATKTIKIYEQILAK